MSKKEAKTQLKAKLEKFVFVRLIMCNNEYHKSQSQKIFEAKYHMLGQGDVFGKMDALSNSFDEYKTNLINQIDMYWEHMTRDIDKDVLDNFYNVHSLSNHTICQAMFNNAYCNRSNMFIQIPNLSNYLEILNSNNTNEKITISCSLMTQEMIDYDIYMFDILNNRNNNLDLSNAAYEYYRPYLFSFVFDLDWEILNSLREIPGIKRAFENGQNEQDGNWFTWVKCNFVYSNEDNSFIRIDGYSVTSASPIKDRTITLGITKDDTISNELNKMVSTTYELSNCTSDDDFIDGLIGSHIDSISSILVYRIGDANSIFVNTSGNGKGFFYDIGYNYRHKPHLNMSSSNQYGLAVNDMCSKDPEFFILSHWDMDHIAGSFVCRKDWLYKKWYTPDCTCKESITAHRLAKYIDLKKNLLHIERGDARLIGNIKIGTINPGNGDEYQLFIGAKAPCDSSFSNCEGIVIKYQSNNKKTVMMMGDVNYETVNKLLPFSQTKIDYLIAPHHGSEHTNYPLLTYGVANMAKIKGTEAIICCTDVASKHRPDPAHLHELEKRFNSVKTTESDSTGNKYIEIKL